MQAFTNDFDCCFVAQMQKTLYDTKVSVVGGLIDWLFNSTSTQKGQFVHTVGNKDTGSVG